MDKVKDIFNNIKDRFSNPLFFSFACSWLVINWQITVALIWYDTKQIEKTDSNTIFEFITSKINVQDALLHPLYLALLYTIFMPTIKNLIRALYSWTEKWGENWNLKILKGGKIPIDKYLKFREDYDKRTKILEDIIVKENEFTSKYNTLNTQLLQAQSTGNELMKQLTDSNNFVQQLNDISMLNGYWINTYKDTVHAELNGVEDIYIQDGRYFLIEKFGNKIHKFNITNFYYDNRRKIMFFTKEPNVYQRDIELRFNVNILQVDQKDLLIGMENGTTNIEYRKKSTFPTQTTKKDENPNTENANPSAR